MVSELAKARPSSGDAAGDVLSRLGVSGEPAVAALRDGTRSYAAVHVALQDVSVGAVLDAVRAPGAPAAVRTGHMGDWSDIAAGRSGALDFNQAICLGGYGVPVVRPFTQTEAETASGPAGDHVYLPGSLVSGGRREPLGLRTWDGRRFALRGRDEPLFCPFVLADVHGASTPLLALHARRARRLAGLCWRTSADLAVERADAVKAMIVALLDGAVAPGASPGALKEVVSQVVALDGTVRRCEVTTTAGAFLVGTRRYADSGELADALLVPFRLAARPDALIEEIGELPQLVPLLSSFAITAIEAVLQATTDGEGVAVHLHWGARAMVGFPPRRLGYMTWRSKTQTLRRLARSLLGDEGGLCFVLLPAAMFLLWPSSRDEGDTALLADLLAVAAASADPGAAAEAWTTRHGPELSPYFLARFRGGRPATDAPGGPVEVEGARSLSMVALCAIVAALDAVLTKRTPT